MVSPPRRLHPDACRGEAGYNMVILMVMVTVLGILVAAALPAWSAAIQRQKEEELIFRGLQYAEAIRVFQQRFGRLPNTLDELIKVEPRSIRRLWDDPLTGKAEWGLVFAQQGGVDANGRPRSPGAIIEGATSGDGDKVTQGPILGVYSLAQGDAILTFMDQDDYSQWRFTLELIAQPMLQVRQETRAVVGFVGVTERLPDLSSRWIGRPWPPEIQHQMEQGGVPVQDGSAPQPAFADDDRR
jgi:type II secretory pathway pseudopilin PulG